MFPLMVSIYCILSLSLLCPSCTLIFLASFPSYCSLSICFLSCENLSFSCYLVVSNSFLSSVLCLCVSSLKVSASYLFIRLLSRSYSSCCCMLCRFFSFSRKAASLDARWELSFDARSLVCWMREISLSSVFCRWETRFCIRFSEFSIDMRAYELRKRFKVLLVDPVLPV